VLLQAKICFLNSLESSEDEITCTEATLKSGDYFGYGEVMFRSLSDGLNSHIHAQVCIFLVAFSCAKAGSAAL